MDFHNIKKQIKKEKWTYIAFSVIMCFFIVMTFSSINKFPLQDEAQWKLAVERGFVYDQELPHPPLAITIYMLAYRAGLPLRIVPIFFNICTLVLLFFFLKKYYNKDIALCGVFIGATSFWFFIASTMIDMNGCILSFLFFLGSVILLLVDNKKETKKIALITILLILIIYTKYAEFMLFAGIYCIWIWMQKELSLNKKIKYVLIPFSITCIAFLLFPLICYLQNNFSYFLSTLQNHGSDQGFLPRLRVIFALMMYGTLFCISFLIAWFKRTKKDTFFFLWFAATIIFYFFIVGSRALSYERYLMTLIIPGIILSALVLNRIIRKNKKILFIGILLLIPLFLFLNMMPVAYIPHDINTYISNVANFKFAFNLPFTGSSGPYYYVNVEVLILLWTLSFLLILAYIIFKKNWILVLLFSLNIASGMVFITDYTFSISHYDYDKAYKQAIDYYKTENLQEPLYYYGWDRAIYVELHPKYAMDFPSNITLLKESIQEKGGTAIIVNFPKISDSDESLLYISSHCELKKEITDREELILKIFACNASK